MIQINASFTPILRDLRKLGVKLTNQSDAMQEVGQYFQRRVEEGFRKEVDPYNKRWAKLSPATIADKQRRGYPLKILTRTRRMRSGVRIIINKKSIRITVPFPSEFHQSGTRKMPQRKIIPDQGRLSKTDERNIKDIFIDYLDI